MPQPQMVYSFKDVHATLTGPGTTGIALGADAGVAEEGIRYEMTEDKDAMKQGADGAIAHSLRGTKSGRVTVSILKTSPTNNLLQTLFNFQSQSSLNWAQGVLIISNIAVGDTVTCQGVAFVRQPPNLYTKDAGIVEWEFYASQIDVVLGSVLI